MGTGGSFEPGVGGTLPITPKMQLAIGKDALPGQAAITADTWIKQTNGTLNWVLYEFGPPMVFLSPITLEIDESFAADLAGPRGHYLLWYFDESAAGGPAWRLADVGEVSGGQVHFAIGHFSKYAVGNPY